ncbi:U11/U12 small nuclear ribonucleoprotein 48 kDa protein [Polymixia lowei]
MTESLETQTIQDRLKRLQELTEFTENCKKQLDDIFETLGWSQDYKGSNQEPMEECPFDPNHRVPVRTMEKHKASCQLRHMNYTPEEQAEMYDSSVCYENTNIRSFIMDKATQHQAILQARAAAPLMRMEGVFWQGQYSGQPVEVPQNHKRSVCDLTVADRLALYDHVITATSQQRDQAASSSNDDLYVDLVAKLKKGDEQNEPKSHLELMAEMRDYKRRRQSYRAKNVHITKKSYTEVIREVIKVHSGELARQWREEEREEEEEEREEEEARRAVRSSQRRRSDDRRSASSESHLSQSRERHSSHSRHQRSPEHSHDRESKRKKRKRDSRSPDDRHHNRKKKKKKKRDEKEK